jgi:hypothetical protein
MIIWWAAMAAAAVALAVFARRGQNAVWGTATLGVVVGVGLAIYEPGFDWWIIAKSIAVAALLGLAFELIPLLARRQR